MRNLVRSATLVVGLALATAGATSAQMQAGLLIKLGSLVSLYAEGRADNVFTEKGVIDSEQIQVVPVTLGLVF